LERDKSFGLSSSQSERTGRPFFLLPVFYLVALVPHSGSGCAAQFHRNQGDQIERFFASCLISLDSFFVNYGFSLNLWPTFFHGKSCVLILTKNRFGQILGDFFTNPSGHPDRNKHGIKYCLNVA
jgi:hypothetical protein